jgi:hypothetical protein
MSILLALLLFLLAGVSFGGTAGTSTQRINPPVVVTVPARHVHNAPSRRDPCLGRTPGAQARAARKAFPKACAPSLRAPLTQRIP